MLSGFLIKVMELNEVQTRLNKESELIHIFIDSFLKLEIHYEVPSFSQIFLEGRIISESLNRVEETGFADAHSEILAVREAESVLGSRYLENCLLFTLLEPCTMCAGAIIHSRISTVYYFADQSRVSGISSLPVEYICRLNYFPRLVKIDDPRAEEKLSGFFHKIREHKSIARTDASDPYTGILL